MNRPLLLDLFCCAGGAAMGYFRAGFDVVGVDIKPQPRYPFRFIQTDALQYLAECGSCYDAIHASPPCQAYCALKHMTTKEYADLIEPTRNLLMALGKPYVIENVPGAPLIDAIMLCGTMFNLETDCGAKLRRHRLFESNVFLMCGLECQHGERSIGVTSPGNALSGGRRVITVTGKVVEGQRTISVAAGHARDKSKEWRKARTISVTGSTPQQNVIRNTERETFSIEKARQAMGIDWMTMAGLSQAIPPAYTEFIGKQLIDEVTERRKE